MGSVNLSEMPRMVNFCQSPDLSGTSQNHHCTSAVRNAVEENAVALVSASAEAKITGSDYDTTSACNPKQIGLFYNSYEKLLLHLHG